MEKGTDHNYDNDAKSELAPLLLGPMDAAQTAQKCRRSKRFVALLVSVTAAAAAMTVLPTGSFEPKITFDRFICVLFCPGYKTQEIRGMPLAVVGCVWEWLKSLQHPPSPDRQYCVPLGQENTCHGYSYALEDSPGAIGIDCIKGQACDDHGSAKAVSHGQDTVPSLLKV